MTPVRMVAEVTRISSSRCAGGKMVSLGACAAPEHKRGSSEQGHGGGDGTYAEIWQQERDGGTGQGTRCKLRYTESG